MGDNSQVTVQIVASISGLLDGLKSAVGAVESSTGQMKDHFEKLNKTVEGVKNAFMAATAVLAGGKMFKDAIDSTVSWNGEVAKMSKSLGMTTESASVLGVALNSLGISTDTYTNAALILSRQLAKGGEAFANFGIETRGANGQLKPAQQLMEESLKTIASYTEGVSRNAAGVAIFGRQWGEVAPLLKLNADTMKEAQERAERLHLIVGPDGVAQAKKYQIAMREVEEIHKSISVQMGNQLLPTLTMAATWLAKEGPAAAEGFSVAIKGVMIVLANWKAYLDTVFQGIAALFASILDGVTTVGKVLLLVIQGEYSKAIAAAKAGAAEVKNDWVNAATSIGEAWDTAAKRVQQIKNPAAQRVSSDPQDGLSYEAPDKGKDRENAWLNKQIDVQLKASEAVKHYLLHQQKYREDHQKRIEKMEDDYTEKVRQAALEQMKIKMHAAEHMGRAFESAFEGMVTGTKSVTKAFVDMTKAIIKMLIEVAIKSVTASAVKSAGEAASATAGIPIIGPILAVGAMTAMLGLVMGLMSSIPGAAAGADIPMGVNPIMQLHGGESIITPTTTDRLKDFLDGQGRAGGGDLNFNFPNARLVDRQWWESNKGQIVSLIRDLRRSGRL